MRLPRERRLLGVWALAAFTLLYTIHSAHRLRELTTLEDVDVGTHTLLELAEENIATQLHLHHKQAAAAGGSRNTAAQGVQDLVQQAPDLAAVGKKIVPKSGVLGLDVVAEDGSKSEGLVEAGAEGGDRARAGPAGSAGSSAKTPPTVRGGDGGNASLIPEECGPVYARTELWGEALVYGPDNVQPSAAGCCERCRGYVAKDEAGAQTCNVWSWCGDRELCGDAFGHCWLKHLMHPTAAAPAKQGPEVGWTTGLAVSAEARAAIRRVSGDARGEGTGSTGSAGAGASEEGGDRSYHVVVTAAGSAVHWQCRVAYYWYRKVQEGCRAKGKCDMGGWTRLLHTGKEDELMGEIPTWVAQPLPPSIPDHGYVVLNRPWALLQWVRAVRVPERYILMSEPDHVWLRPMANLMLGERPAAFPFFYIVPAKAEYLPITRQFVGDVDSKEAERIAPIGNAPTMLSRSDFERVMPAFYNLSLAVHSNKEAVKAWGWVQEMYAFTMSLYVTGLKDVDLHVKWMAQPPWDTALQPYYILHYTYGMDFDEKGTFTPGKVGYWHWDKRDFSSRPPPRKMPGPPDGTNNDLARHLISAINEASEAIPGWDHYHETGVATEFWDGKTFLGDAEPAAR